jgi:hypothetical protein
MRAAAPSVFSAGKHASCSKRYTYITTVNVLRGLCHRDFEPFMAAQCASRIEGTAKFTKHVERMRYAGGDSASAMAEPETNVVILINSRDGASCHHSRR